MVWVRVPASSANMGAGFDSMGIALSLYNEIGIEECAGGIIVENRNPGEFVPTGENNMIYRAAKRVFDETGYRSDGLKIIQNSRIPMTRGLGSSSACIIGGMLAANVISGRKLTYGEILNIASDMEGHPDNVAPALYGGFCTAVRDGAQTVVNSVKIEQPLCFVAMIPDFFVSTRKSRVSLPENVSHKDAAFNAGHAALFAVSLATGRLDRLRTAVQDKLHQPYRAGYIEHMEETFSNAYKNGAYAAWLSGSGPTMIAVIDKSNTDFITNMNAYFVRNEHKWRCKRLGVDNVGAIVCEYRRGRI